MGGDGSSRERREMLQRAVSLARAYGQVRFAFLSGDPRAQALLSSREADEQIRQLAFVLGIPPGTDAERLARLAGAYEGRSAFEESYERTFQGARLLSPFETDYTTSSPFEQANELADISGFFRAFNLTWACGQVDRADHIGSELEFLCALSGMEAKAIEEGRVEQAEVASQAHASFLVDHAGRWFALLAHQCRAKGAPEFFQAASQVAADFVREDMRSRGLEAKSVSASALPVV